MLPTNKTQKEYEQCNNQHLQHNKQPHLQQSTMKTKHSRAETQQSTSTRKHIDPI
jgi:hypothetical protein